MLKKAPNRLLTRAAQKRDSVLPGSYRAATARERSPASPFQHRASLRRTPHQVKAGYNGKGRLS